MQNIEKQVKELFSLAQENKEKHIKGESDLSELKNLENQLDRQEQYSRRNCILIHGITETQDKTLMIFL